MQRGKRLYKEDLLKMDGQKVLVHDEYWSEEDIIHIVELNHKDKEMDCTLDALVENGKTQYYDINYEEFLEIEVYEMIEGNEVPINKLYMAKTKSNAIIPTKRKEDTGRDVYTCETETIVIYPNSTRLIDTGIAIACNKAWFPKFFDKGGMGSNGIIVGAGVGDSGYRDGYFIPLINTNKDKYLVITSQDMEEIKNSTCFNLNTKLFSIDTAFVKGAEGIDEDGYINPEICIIKPLNKAITQFVILPVPELNDEEISWEDLKNISSERGLGKCGSSGK